MIYRRELEGEIWTALLNFSGRTVKLPSAAADLMPPGEPAVSNTGRRELEGGLLPWEGALFHQTGGKGA
jgi:hypothetical protein